MNTRVFAVHVHEWKSSKSRTEKLFKKSESEGDYGGPDEVFSHWPEVEFPERHLQDPGVLHLQHLLVQVRSENGTSFYLIEFRILFRIDFGRLDGYGSRRAKITNQKRINED